MQALSSLCVPDAGPVVTALVFFGANAFAVRWVNGEPVIRLIRRGE